MVKTKVAIIGAGIVGGFIFDTLVLNGIDCVLLEKGEDVSLGATKANSGIIHAGYDCAVGTLKAKFNVLGNKMYEEVANRLGEKIVNCGSLVVGDKDSLPKLKDLFERGKKNGVEGLEILEKNKLHELEPNLSENICYGLFAKTTKIISPYHFCISLVEEGILNGGKFFLNCQVEKIAKAKEGFELKTNQGDFECEYLINACAEGVNEINKLINEAPIKLKFTKGEYMLLDNSEGGLVFSPDEKCLKGLVGRPIFPLPTEKGKGILACPTVNNNIFFGPTAVDVKEYDTAVNYDSLSTIKSQVVDMVDNINFKKVIKLYAGVRVKTEDDFYLKFSDKNPNYLVISGICSPGLSSAPAIASWVFEELKKRGVEGKKIKFVKRKPYTNILSLDKDELDKLIKKDSNYGEIVCRCETISKGEILEVLKGPIKPLTTDGVKRRLRTTMGRCQGSFCYPKLIKILADFYKKDEKDINFKGKNSVVIGDIKQNGIYEKK